MQLHHSKECHLAEFPTGRYLQPKANRNQHGLRQAACADPNILRGAPCAKIGNDQWHGGTEVARYWPEQSPNGVEWTWQECAAMCARRPDCAYWLRQQRVQRHCILSSSKTDLRNNVNNVHDHGDRMLTCAYPSVDPWSAPPDGQSPRLTDENKACPPPPPRPTPHAQADAAPHAQADAAPHADTAKADTAEADTAEADTHSHAHNPNNPNTPNHDDHRHGQRGHRRGC